MRWWLTMRAVRWFGLPVADVLLGAGLAAVSAVTSAEQHLAGQPWVAAASAVAAGALVLRTRRPLAMAFTAAAAIALLAVLPEPATPLPGFVGILLLAFSVAAHLPGDRAVAGLGALLVAGWILQFASDSDPAERLVTPVVLIGAPALAGWLLRRSRAQAATLHRLAGDLAAERELHAQAVAVAERNRIARELHDVIAHAVSVMVVQAGAAEQVMGTDDPALPHVRAVRTAGRDALAELRRSLGILRSGEHAPTLPQPTLDDLPLLAAQAGADLTVTGTPPTELPPGLHLAAYRIAQEALTNARRHAPGAPVRMRLDHRDPGAMTITVEDDGTAAPRLGARGDAGHGLTGMVERAALFGGEVQAGPKPDARGWRVVARLPLPAALPEREVVHP